MVKDYKITGKLVPGSIYLRYEDAVLTTVLLELNSPMNDQIWQSFKGRLNTEENLRTMNETFDVKELTNGRSVQDKIVMFCSAFKHYRGIPYKAKETEKANLKNAPVTRELLDVWFKSPLANYTLENYIKRINVTRDWARNGMNNHLLTAFPDDYDPTFEATLTGEKLAAYWSHLREKGWKKTERGWINE